MIGLVQFLIWFNGSNKVTNHTQKKVKSGKPTIKHSVVSSKNSMNRNKSYNKVSPK